MAVDMFLELEGIKGESQDKAHKGKIEIESFSWGATQTGTHSGGGGGGAGKVNMQDFHFVMKNNSASPHLFALCAKGDHIKKATLICRKAGGKQQEFLTVKFADLLVSSYQTGGSAHGGEVPMDQISLNFSKIEIDYKEQKADGTLGASIKKGYDLKTNTAS